MENKKGLGDIVEKIIIKTMPTMAEKYKDCKSCKNRKIFLNNVGAIFS